MFSKKSGKNNYNTKQMIDMGYIIKGRFSMHRFIYPRDNRKNIIIEPRKKEIIQTKLMFTEDGHTKIIKPKKL